MPIGTLADLPLAKSIYYAGRDSDVTLRLYPYLLSLIKSLGLERLLSNGMEHSWIIEQMEQNGMVASIGHFRVLDEKLRLEMIDIQDELIHAYYDSEPFNPNSRLHVIKLLEMRGLEPLKKTKKDKPSTSKKSIEYRRCTDHAIGLVFDWRERRHLRDSFCKPILNIYKEQNPSDEDLSTELVEYVGKELEVANDGDEVPESRSICDLLSSIDNERLEPFPPNDSLPASDLFTINCRIQTTRTHTRRLATKDPNFLAIPIRSGPEIRNGYKCQPHEAYGAWDYSGHEMRVMAHLSRDKKLCKWFNNGDDVHSEVASLIFDIPIADVDKTKHRIPAKTAGFGIIYGIGGQGLLDQLKSLGLTDWTMESCDDIIKEWLTMCGGVKDFMHDTRMEVYYNPQHMVRDYWGMIRYLPGIISKDRRVSAEAGRHAVSHKVQGMAQGMIQNATRYLWKQIKVMQQAGMNILPRLQVHDELVTTSDRGLWPVLNDLIIDAMVNHSEVELCVPIMAEGAVSDTWGGLKQ